MEKAAEFELLGNDSVFDKTLAATALAAYDPLFAPTGFQDKVWQEMLKEYQQKRAAKK